MKKNNPENKKKCLEGYKLLKCKWCGNWLLPIEEYRGNDAFIQYKCDTCPTEHLEYKHNVRKK